MNKVLLTGFLSALLITTQAQNIIVSPNQTDYCTGQNITISYSNPPAPGTHYEWQYEDYNAGWNPVTGLPNTILNYGSSPSITIHSGTFGPTCTIRLLVIDDATLNLISGQGVKFCSNKGTPASIPWLNSTYSNACGNLEVPIAFDPYGNFPNRWAMWYKNGQPTGITSFNYGTPYDSAIYEYKVKLNCGDTMTTGPILLVRPSLPTISFQGSSTGCTGDSVALVATKSSGTVIEKWYLNGTAITGSDAKTTIYVKASGTYTVKSKHSSGTGGYCYLTSSPVTVTINPGAYITGTDKACSTDSAQLSCTPAASYQWKKNGVNISGATGQTLWVKSTGNYTVVTSGLTCNSSSAKTFTSYPVPTGLSVSPSSTTSLCSGSIQPLSITGSNISGWQWYRNGTSMPGANSAGIVATKTGSYKCVVTNAIGCSKTSATVQVSAAPVATLPQKTLVLQPGTDGIDSYITSNFGSYSSNFGTAATIEISNWYKYFRNAERGYLQFDLSQIPDFSAVTSATLKLFVDSIAQSSTYANLPNSLFIKRNTQPWTESTISWGNSPDSTEYQSVAIPCSTITSSSFLSANIVELVRHWVSTPAERFGMLLQLNDYNQVSWLKIASSDTAAPNYRPKLTVTYYAADINASGPTNLCTGGSVQFSTNAGAYTYQWYKNGNPIAGATASTYTATTAGDYHVVLTASSGCTARSLVKKVTVNGPPQINLTPAADSISYCFGSPITLSVDSLAGYSFQWQRNNANVSGAIYRTFSPTTTAWYSIKSTSNCGVTAKDSVYITRINNAAPVISAGGPTSFCAGQSVLLTSTTFAGATTKWYKGTSLVATATSYTATTAGAYSVTQTASGCSKTSNIINLIVNCREGEFTAEGNMQIEVYPNPGSDIITISVTGNEKQELITFTLTDINGKEISRFSTTDNLQQISVRDLASGVYLIEASTTNSITGRQRIIIQR